VRRVGGCINACEKVLCMLQRDSQGARRREREKGPRDADGRWEERASFGYLHSRHVGGVRLRRGEVRRERREASLSRDGLQDDEKEVRERRERASLSRFVTPWARFRAEALVDAEGCSCRPLADSPLLGIGLKVHSVPDPAFTETLPTTSSPFFERLCPRRPSLSLGSLQVDSRWEGRSSTAGVIKEHSHKLAVGLAGTTS
jgi:hypothetical protein